MNTKSKTFGPKKRYTKKEDIIAQIDKFTRKRDDKHKQSARLLQDAKELFRMAADPKCVTAASLNKEANWKNTQAEKLGKQVKRLEDKVLPVWKRKLAEFQTEVIPGFLPDNSAEAP